MKVIKKYIFLLWTVFVFISYVLYLFQKGKGKW